MSVAKIGTGTTVPPWKLKDATFTKLSSNSKFFCRIDTTDGETYYLTGKEATRLAQRGGVGPSRFEAWKKNTKDDV
jgi:hypothetical protein